MSPSFLAPAALGLPLLLLQLLPTPIQAFTWHQPVDGDKILGSFFGLPGQDATYDYVVVGGGLAGLVTATRLAENGTFSVAVVEAGSFYEFTNSNKSQIPWYSESSVSDDPEGYINLLIDWGLVTTPQPVCGDLIPTFPLPIFLLDLAACISDPGTRLMSLRLATEQSPDPLCSRQDTWWLICPQSNDLRSRLKG